MAVSTDNDQSYPHRRNIVDKPDDTAAYRSAIQGADGKIHVVYTSRARAVINHAVFEKEDVLGAEPNSDP